MKKLKVMMMTLMMCFVTMFANAADWVETFGPDDAVSNSSYGEFWPYVPYENSDGKYVYKNFDHVADCTYDGFIADVRQVNASPTTEAIGNHVWLGGAGYYSYSCFSISGIKAAGARYVSFDLAIPYKAYVPNMKLFINDVEVDMPSLTWTTANVMQNVGDIAITSADVYKIEIQNLKRTLNTGIRIDNVTFKADTATKHVTIDNSVYTNNGTIYAAGEFQIFSVSGRNVTELNGQLNGIYVVKTAKGIQKVAVK